MLEVDCTMLTPDPVLRASGHVERFSDYMVKDMKTGECFRADHLLEDHLEKLAADPKCPQDKIKEYKDIIAKVSHVIKVGQVSLSSSLSSLALSFSQMQSINGSRNNC